MLLLKELSENCCVSCVEEWLTIPRGVCIAPLRAYIPRDLWSSLPENFLDSGIVDSHDAEQLLLNTHASHVTDTFVYPRAGYPRTLQYRPRSSLGKLMMQSVPHVIVQALLDFKLMENL